MERNELLLAITRCPEIERARGDAGHPCHLVVCFQDAAGYHVPEPWQGYIETAPILFVSLNPGYGENQVFLTLEWTDADTIDFSGGALTRKRAGLATLLGIAYTCG